MGNSGKLLKIIFVILLLVTAGELAYYVYIQFSSGKNQRVSSNPVEENIRLISTPAENKNEDLPIVNTEHLERLNEYTKLKNRDIKFLLITEYDGILTEINKEGKLVGKTLFPLGLKIKTSKNEGWTYFSPELFNKREIYSEKQNNLISVSLDELRAGNHIKVQEISDLSYSPTDKRHSRELVIKIIDDNPK